MDKFNLKTYEVIQLRTYVAELRREKEDWKQKFSDLENKMERLMLSVTTAHKQRESGNWEEHERSLMLKLSNVLNTRI